MGFYTDPWTFQADTMLAGPTTYDMGAGATAGSGAAAASGFNFGQAGIGMSIAGALSSAIGSFYSAKLQKQNLQYQSQMSAINARMAENTAQSALDQGQRAVAQQTMKAGQVKSAQRAALAANGVDLGVGSAAEVLASTDIVKDMDKNTIEANAVRAAWGYRTQATNYANQSLLEGTSAQSVSPWSAAGASLLGNAGEVAKSWYSYKKAF